MSYLAMLRSNVSAAVLVPALILGGCTTSTNFVNYKQRALYSSDTVGGMEYVEVGPAVSKASGYIWDSCDELQQRALAGLREEREALGANSVFDVRWVNHAEGTLSDTPICTTGWGWFVGFVAPGFGPWVKVTEVRGKMAFVSEDNRAAISAGSEKLAEETAKARAEAKAKAEAEARAKAQAEAEAKAKAAEEQEADSAADNGDAGQQGAEGEAQSQENSGDNEQAEPEAAAAE